METLGAASAATLGYIVGNLPGAYYGYQAYRNMPPITRRRTRAAGLIQRVMRKWRSRGYPGGATSRVLSGMRAANRQHNSTVTRQKDFSSQYRFKRMPKRRRIRWKKFVKKVTAVELKNAAMKTVVFNDKIANSSGVGKQAYISFALYGINGLDDDTGKCCGYRDIQKVFDNDPQIKQVAVGSPPAYYPKSGKLHFGSAVLDFTLRNIAEQEAEIDIYYGYHLKDTTNVNAVQVVKPSLVDEFINDDPNSIKSGNAMIRLEERGTTPFDCSSALSSSGFHVLKKQKILIEPGKSVFIQHRDANNHEMDYDSLIGLGYAKKKLTYEVLIVHKPTVSTATDLTSTIVVGVTRKYSYTVLSGANQPQGAYDPAFDPAA